MFGFLSSVAFWLQVRVVRKLKKSKKRLNAWRSKVDRTKLAQEGENSQHIDERLLLGRIKLWVLWFVSLVVKFFESLPLFFLLLMAFLKGICIIGAIIIILMLATFFKSVVSDFLGTYNIKDLAESFYSDHVEWSEAELAIRGMLLTEEEKNWYRLIMLYKKHIDYNGYYYPKDNISLDLPLPFMVGIVSIESGGSFYKEGSGGKNILVTPSDRDNINSSGYTGVFGLKYNCKLADYFGLEGYTKYLKEKYVPDKNYTVPTTDVLYIPWASAISAKHIYGKISEQRIDRDEIQEIANNLMDGFGIYVNRDEFYNFMIWSLASAAYHGCEMSEWKHYMAFWCAVYALTSEIDADRSMDKWGIDYAGYDESTVRQLILGNIHYSDLHKYSSPEDLPIPDVDAMLTLNGRGIGRPLWTYVYQEFGYKQEIKDAWQEAKRLSVSVPARVLNFHYGFNSYMQGEKVINNIKSKLVGSVFQETPGVGQGVWDGKNILDYLQGNSKALGFQKYWGTAKYIKAQKIDGIDWEPDDWGVPFYKQDSSEVYGRVKWGNETFSESGCMIYAYAYAASALTGKLINPPEMASGMYVGNALTPSGVAVSRIEYVFKELGLKADLVVVSSAVGKHVASDKEFDKIWAKVDNTLLNNGLVVLRGGEPWASGSNHFFVLTGIKKANNGYMYKVYTSSKVSQVMAWWDKNAFRNTIHRELHLITK